MYRLNLFFKYILRLSFPMLCLSLAYCRVGNTPEKSEVKANNGPIQIASRAPRPSPGVSPAIYAKVRYSVGQKLVAAQACRREVPKTLVQNIIVSELSGMEFQPSETARLIHEVFDPDLPICGQQACSKVTGINMGKNLRAEMDALKKLAQKTSPPSAKSFDPEPTSLGQGSSFGNKMLTRREFCGAGLLTAFSLLNPPSVKSVTKEHLASVGGSFDLRQGKPMKTQGYTGSCHAFATSEVLRHGDLKLSLDIPRFFVDFWTHRLGPNLEVALATEVHLQRRWVKDLQKMIEGKNTEEEKMKALEKFVINEGSDIQDDPQGGWASLDLADLKSHGAVLKGSSGLSQLTFEDLGILTAAIEKSRLQTLAIAYKGGQDKITDEGIREGTRATYERLYAIAAESANHPSRLTVKLKLRGYQFKTVLFNRDNMEASVELFFKNIKNQPAYLSSGTHATALVGYNESKKIFIVRNSHFDTYSELNIDEVFNNIKKYAFLERSP